MEINFDPNESGFKQSPWKTYNYLRKNKPIFYSRPERCFYLMSYPLVKKALMSADLGVYHPLRLTRQVLGPSILDTDGEKHKKFKALIVELFNPSSICRYQADFIKPVVSEAITRIKDKKTIDWVKEVAETVPGKIISGVMGFSPEDSDWIYQTLKPVMNVLNTSGPDMQQGVLAREKLERFLDQKFAGSSPGKENKYCTKIREIALSQGVEVDYKEVLHHAMLLLVAGTETTTCAICSLMYCLTGFPEYQKSLRAGRLDAGAFVKEVIRWQAPLHFTVRFSLKDLSIDGISIPRDSLLQLCIASANRDEDFFDDAENFNPAIDRKDNLAFGGGQHNCPGMNFARTELEMVLKEVLGKTAWVSTLEGPFIPYPGLSFRRPERLLIKMEV